MTNTVVDGVVLTPKMLDTLRAIQEQNDSYGDYLDEITDLLINNYRKIDVPAEEILKHIKVLRIVAYEVLGNLIPINTVDGKDANSKKKGGAL